MSNRKVMIIHLIAGLVKKVLSNKNKLVESYLSNYITKSDWKSGRGVNASQFTKNDILLDKSKLINQILIN